MLSHAPLITLSFAVEEPTVAGSSQTQPPLTEAQRLKAIESYALIAASHPVSVQRDLVDQSSAGLSLLLQDTFRNHVRHNVPNQISYLQTAVRRRPSKELRQMFAAHEAMTESRNETEAIDSIFSKMRTWAGPRRALCQS